MASIQGRVILSLRETGQMFVVMLTNKKPLTLPQSNMTICFVIFFYSYSFYRRFCYINCIHPVHDIWSKTTSSNTTLDRIRCLVDKALK